MELSRHHVVGVTGENGDTVPRCAVPYTNRLIIGRWKLSRVPVY